MFTHLPELEHLPGNSGISPFLVFYHVMYLDWIWYGR